MTSFELKDIVNSYMKTPAYTTFAINNWALENAIHGMELFEIPTAGLGTPKEVLEALKHDSVRVAYWTGLGQVKIEGYLGYGGKSYTLDELLEWTKNQEGKIREMSKEERSADIVCLLVNNSFKYSPIIQLGTKDGGGGKELNPTLLKFFKENEDVNEQFMDSLEEYKHTNYYGRKYQQHLKIPENANYLFQLLQELENPKITWEFGNWKGKRMKFRSEHPDRYGSVYFTKAKETAKGYDFSCSCPAGSKKVLCKHVKGLQNNLFNM